MKHAEVIDARGPGAAVSGTQAQAFTACRLARLAVESCDVALLCAFIPTEDGGHRVEVAVDGRGPKGMSEVVFATLQKVSHTLRDAMREQEVTAPSEGEAS